MTIDVVTKAGTQIGISMSPEELTASGWILDMIRMLIGGETENTPRAERTPEAIAVEMAAALMKAKAPAKKTAPAKESTPKNPRALEIDKGKIVALWTAGWKIKDIAEECGCSTQTVYNTLEAKGLRVVKEATAE